MNAEEIKEVTAKELSEFIRSWCDDIPGVRPYRCRIVCKEGSGTYTAVDNRSGYCWIEYFETRQEAIDWLNNEIEKAD